MATETALTLTSAQIRAVEEAAVAGGLDWLRLMENAGSAAAACLRARLPVAGKRVVVVCGKGNNGGDGLVMARRLHADEAHVTIVLAQGEPATANAREMFSLIDRADIPVVRWDAEPFLAGDCLRGADVIVDAVYGLGFHGALADPLRALFRQMNEAPAPVLAVDLPSGVDADTGEADPDAVRAAWTVTFIAAKPGLAAAATFTGKVFVAAIGIDDSLLAPYCAEPGAITWEQVRAALPARPADSHKGDYGRLLTLCGHPGMWGAAALALRAALRSGVGLAVAALPRSLYPLAAGTLLEPVYCLLDETPDGDFALSDRAALRREAAAATAVLVGCGLGQSPGARALVDDLLSACTCPLILDADGINCVAGHIDKLKTNAPRILTPHPGELARLTGQTVAAVQADRLGQAARLAEQTGAVVVLKGHRTVVAAPGEMPLVNTTGNPGMATGGSGDVLAGLIAGLAAQGLPSFTAAVCGVHLHGLAGDRAAKRLSQRSLLPSDMIEELGGLFLDCEQ